MPVLLSKASVHYHRPACTLLKPHTTPGLVLDWRIHPANALAPNSLGLWVSFSSALNISFMTGTFFCLVAKSIFASEVLRTFIVVWWLCSWHHFSGYWKYNEGNKKCYWLKTAQLIPGHTCRWTVQHNRIISEQRAETSFQSLGLWIEGSCDESIGTGLWASHAKPKDGQSVSQQHKTLLSLSFQPWVLRTAPACQSSQFSPKSRCWSPTVKPEWLNCSD